MAEPAIQREQMIGRTLRDKWRVDALLGAGGMATVYAATHRNGMRGAIKVLHPHLSHAEELRARLVREGYVANRVKHPGVVRILDDDVTEDGLAFIVMELLEGEPWKARWQKAGRMLPLEEVLRGAAKVLDILRVAHAAGVIHRDIKPDNVFLTAEGEVKLLDFGIARLREANAEQTQTGSMLGTPAFMSPEQALAKWSKVDARSDLFSVGATIWTLATGRMLHPSTTVPELLVAVATKPPAPFASAYPDATPEVSEAIDRALAFEPDDRWPTAEAMLAAVERGIASLTGERPARRASDSAIVAGGQTVRMNPNTAPSDAESTAPAASMTSVAAATPPSVRGTGITTAALLASPPAEPASTKDAPSAPPSTPTDAATETNHSTSHSIAEATKRGVSSVERAPEKGRAGFGSGLATGGAIAAAFAAAFGIYVYTRPAAKPPEDPARPSTEAPVVSSATAAPSALPPAPSVVSSVESTPSAPSASPSTTAPRIARVPPPTSTRPFSDSEAERALAQWGEIASRNCASRTTEPVSITVTGHFNPNGTFEPTGVLPSSARFTPVGTCVEGLFHMSISSFDGPPHPAVQPVTVVPR